MLELSQVPSVAKHETVSLHLWGNAVSQAGSFGSQVSTTVEQRWAQQIFFKYLNVITAIFGLHPKNFVFMKSASHMGLLQFSL
jgi:hypothetical protein